MPSLLLSRFAVGALVVGRYAIVVVVGIKSVDQTIMSVSRSPPKGRSSRVGTPSPSSSSSR